MNYVERIWHTVPVYQKIFYIIAPLLWGALVWFMAFGPGKLLLPAVPYRYQLNLLTRISIASLFIFPFFGRSLVAAAKQYIPMIARCKIPVLHWVYIVGFMFLVTFMSCFVTPIGAVFNSFVLGTLISSIIEELLTRSPIITFRMTFKEFLVYNILSSLAFAMMHTFYQEVPTFAHALCVFQSEYSFVSYIGLSFMFGIIAYKTRRIEVCMLLHMLVNFDWLIKTYWVDQGYTSLLIQLLITSCVAWCGYREKAE